MPERREIEALREAVDRTVRATLDTGNRAQGAAGGVGAAVDDLLRGAERGLTRGRRGVRAAVEDRMPASHDDVRALTDELQSIDRRLAAIERRLGDVDDR